MTRILESIRAGDDRQVELLYEVVYEELKRMASELLRHERGGGRGVTPSSLVSRAYVRLVGRSEWDSRAHFFGAAARAMGGSLEFTRDGGQERVTVRLPRGGRA